jgi:hypothetical protein
MLELWDGDYAKWQASQLFTWTYVNQTTSWLMQNWNTFNAWMSQGHTWTHKIHHNPNLGEATTFPLILFSMISHKGYPNVIFSKTPKLGVLKFPKLWLPTFWKATTSWGEVQRKVVALVKSFLMICDVLPECK